MAIRLADHLRWWEIPSFLMASGFGVQLLWGWIQADGSPVVWSNDWLNLLGTIMFVTGFSWFVAAFRRERRKRELIKEMP